MHAIWVLAIFILHCTITKSCTENETCTINLEDKNIQALLRGMETFTDKLMYRLYTDEVIGKLNIAFSPLSVYFSLALMLFGSTDQTLILLNEALSFPVDTDWQTLQNDLKAILDALEVKRSETVNSQYVINENVFLGQALFLQNDFKLQEPYQQFLKMIHAQNFFVDFKAQQETLKIMQDWIATQTSKNVNVGLYKPFPQTSEMLIISTVFFTAQWEDGLFPSNYNGEGSFRTTPDTEIKNIGVMRSNNKELLYLDVPNYFTCIQLPYKGGDNRMLIVLPYPEYTIGDFVKQFNMDNYRYILQNSKPKKAVVIIPEFIGIWTSTLGQYLRPMGLQDIFDKAQLGNMIQNFHGGIEVADVLHAAAMEFDESGTTVSTSSSNAIFGVSMMQIQSEEPVEIPLEFVIDRPFKMFITNIQTGLPIFATLIRDI